ncbi:hypothetical protein L596_022363 [Steinernema carpocapsae]|uniref:Uncharacterized protein n=1 Tax=Steinernema carpocapsae TaxID=34508 RepID=A0A4U5MLV9_STECR|nr:hypothetical protein L596_022363 [Steinernema carpocapsae]
MLNFIRFRHKTNSLEQKNMSSIWDVRAQKCAAFRKEIHVAPLLDLPSLSSWLFHRTVGSLSVLLSGLSSGPVVNALRPPSSVIQPFHSSTLVLVKVVAMNATLWLLLVAIGFRYTRQGKPFTPGAVKLAAPSDDTWKRAGSCKQNKFKGFVIMGLNGREDSRHVFFMDAYQADGDIRLTSRKSHYRKWKYYYIELATRSTSRYLSVYSHQSSSECPYKTTHSFNVNAKGRWANSPVETWCNSYSKWKYFVRALWYFYDGGSPMPFTAPKASGAQHIIQSYTSSSEAKMVRCALDEMYDCIHAPQWAVAMPESFSRSLSFHRFSKLIWDTLAPYGRYLVRDHFYPKKWYAGDFGDAEEFLGLLFASDTYRIWAKKEGGEITYAVDWDGELCKYATLSYDYFRYVYMIDMRKHGISYVKLPDPPKVVKKPPEKKMTPAESKSGHSKKHGYS